MLQGTNRSKSADVESLVGVLQFSRRWDMLVKFNNELSNKEEMNRFRNDVLDEVLHEETKRVRHNIKLPKANLDELFLVKWEEHFWIEFELDVRVK